MNAAIAPPATRSAFPLEIKLEDRSRVCRTYDELLAFLLEIAAPFKAGLVRLDEADQEVRRCSRPLARALRQARLKAGHGTWLRLLNSLKINQKTLGHYIKVEVEFYREDGTLDPESVRKAQAVHLAAGTTGPAVSLDPEDLKYSHLRTLAYAPKGSNSSREEFGTPGSGGVEAGSNSSREEFDGRGSTTAAGEWDCVDEAELESASSACDEAGLDTETPALPGLPPDAVARGGVHRADDAAPPAPRPAAEEVGGRHEQLTFASVYESVAALGRTQDRVMDLIRGGRSDLAAECERLAREHDERLRELLARSEAA